jgi:hypothetical protein
MARKSDIIVIATAKAKPGRKREHVKTLMAAMTPALAEPSRIVAYEILDEA